MLETHLETETHILHNLERIHMLRERLKAKVIDFTPPDIKVTKRYGAKDRSAAAARPLLLELEEGNLPITIDMSRKVLPQGVTWPSMHESVPEFLHVVKRESPAVGYTVYQEDFDLWIKQARLRSTKARKAKKDALLEAASQEE